MFSRTTTCCSRLGMLHDADELPDLMLVASTLSGEKPKSAKLPRRQAVAHGDDREVEIGLGARMNKASGASVELDHLPRLCCHQSRSETGPERLAPIFRVEQRGCS